MIGTLLGAIAIASTMFGIHDKLAQTEFVIHEHMVKVVDYDGIAHMQKYLRYKAVVPNEPYATTYWNNEVFGEIEELSEESAIIFLSRKEERLKLVRDHLKNILIGESFTF